MKSGILTSVNLMRLKRALGLSQYQAVGLLECLWHFTAHNTPDGGIGKYSDDDIAAVLEWENPAKELIDALVDSGWIDRNEDGSLWIHDWMEHCPVWVKGVAARQMARKSIKDGTKYGTKCPTKDGTKYGTKYGTKLEPQEEKEKDPFFPPSNLPPHPPLILPPFFPEKEKEEAPAQIENLNEEILFAPLIDGTKWEITKFQIDQLAKSFPGMDIRIKILGALAWLQANPKKRKTAKGMPRFLTGWLLRDISVAKNRAPRPDLSKIGSNSGFEKIGGSGSFLERLANIGNEETE